MVLYSKNDLIFMSLALVLMLIITAALYFLLKDKSERAKRIPFVVIAALMIVLEIFKQIENFTSESVNIYWLPFHYCSLFFFFFPLAEFTHGRIREYFKAVSFVAALTVSIFIYIVPQGILGKATDLMFKELFHLHSFVFHHLVILYVFLSIALDSYRYKRGDFLRIASLFCGYCLIVNPLSHITNTNFCNFLYTIIPPLEYIRVNFGQLAYSLVFLVGIPLGTASVGYIYGKIRQRNESK